MKDNKKLKKELKNKKINSDKQEFEKYLQKIEDPNYEGQDVS